MTWRGLRRILNRQPHTMPPSVRLHIGHEATRAIESWLRAEGTVPPPDLFGGIIVADDVRDTA